MDNIIDEVVRAGFVISKGLDIKQFIASLIDQLFDVTGSDIVCFYSRSEERVRLLYRRGKISVPGRFSPAEDPFSLSSNDYGGFSRWIAVLLKSLLRNNGEIPDDQCRGM